MRRTAEEVVSSYRDLQAEAAAHAAEGWSPSPVEDWKNDFAVTAAAFEQFRRHSISAGTINFPDRPALRPTKVTPEFFSTRSQLEIAHGHLTIWRRYLQLRQALPAARRGLMHRLARDDGAYGAHLWFVPGVGLATEASVRYSYYAATLSSKLDGAGSILEIGAGFGGLAERLVPALRPTRYFITDLPLNLALAWFNLSARFPNEVGRVWFRHETLGPERIQIVAPWRLADLGTAVAAAVNTVSFQHMSFDNLRYYGNVMEKLGVRWLYQVNRDVKRDATDVPCTQYPFRNRFRVVESRPFPFVGRNILEELLAVTGEA